MGSKKQNIEIASDFMKILSELKPVAIQKYKAEIKGIFGSYAKGNAKQESDLDVLVEFDESANLLHFVGLALFLEEKLHVPVDVVQESDLRNELKRYILQEVVYI